MDTGNLPYTEKAISNNVFIRSFSKKNAEEFLWHRDREDRIIESLDSTDWKFQFDNQLPIPIVGKLFIPKNEYHRIIVGTGDLKLKIIKF